MDSKIRANGSRKKRPTPRTVIGTGLVALDVVIADSFDVEPVLCAGGTCGNVLTALSFLGWRSYPIARLRSDAASKRVTKDLRDWNVKLDFVSLDSDGSTPVVVQHIRRNKSGEPSHSFSRKCPKCGTWLPWYKAVRNADVPDIAARLPSADVFYFDRTSRGALSLARYAFERGWMVFFEPSAGSEPEMLAEALEVSHVVKIASDRLAGNEGVLEAETPVLLIETRGSEGLRFKLKTTKTAGRWKTLSAFETDAVKDTAGAGDWCTTAIISRLGPLGVAGLKSAAPEVVSSAIRFGQAMAAWACRYHGARGGMYELSKPDLLKAVKAILDGESNAKKQEKAPTAKSGARKAEWCDACLEGGRKE